MEVDAQVLASKLLQCARDSADPLVRQIVAVGLASFTDTNSEVPTDLLASLESATLSELVPMSYLAQLLVADQVRNEDPRRALSIYQDLRKRASALEKAQISLKAAELTENDKVALELAEEASVLGFDDREVHADAQIFIGQRSYKSDPEHGLKILCDVAESSDRNIATRAAICWQELVGEPDNLSALSLYERIFREGPESIAGICAFSYGLLEEKRNPRKSRKYFARAAAAPVAESINYLGARGWLQALKGDPRADKELELREASNGSNANVAAIATLELAYRAGKKNLRFVQESCQRVMEVRNSFLAERAAGYLASLIRKERPQAAARLLEPLLSSRDDEIRSNARLNIIGILRRSDPARATEIAAEALADENGEKRLQSALHYASALQCSNPEYAHELYGLAATSSNPEIRSGGKIFLAEFVASSSMTEAEGIIDSVIAEGIPEYSITAATMMSRLWFEVDRSRSDKWMRRAGEILEAMPPREHHLKDEDDTLDDDID